jgi:hypothetical protein
VTARVSSIFTRLIASSTTPASVPSTTPPLYRNRAPRASFAAAAMRSLSLDAPAKTSAGSLRRSTASRGPRVSRRRRERVRRVIARRRQARAHPTLVGARRTNNEKRIVTSLPIQKKNPSRLASQPLIVVVVVVVYHIASHP